MIYAELAPLVFAAILVLMIPGLLVSWASGARGWVLAGSAGPVSVSVIAVTAILTGFAGLPWGMVVVLAVSAVLAAAIFVLRRVLPKPLRDHGAPLPSTGSVHGGASGHGHRHRHRADMLIGWFVVVVVFLVLFWRLGQIFGGIDNISQTFDNVFHLNAVRYIVDTGNASSLRVSGFTSSTGMGGFYPAAWHDVASLTQQLTGSTVPAAVNASNVAIAALVWPLSCLLLATAIFGRRRIVVVATAAFSAGLGSFPYLMLDFGVLYPNLLSIALLPASIGLLALSLRVARGLVLPTVSAWILALGTLPGVALAHPSTLLALFAWTLPIVLAAAAALFVRFLKRSDVWRAAGVVLGFVVYTGILAIAWQRLRPDEAQSTWQPVQGLAQAFGQALTSAPQGRPIPWLIFAMTLFGIWAMLRQRRFLWLLAMFGISCVMFIVVSGYPFGPVRTWFGGVWYNDPFRPAALLPVAALPVAVLGVVWLTDLAQGWVRSQLAEGRLPRSWSAWATGSRVAVASAVASVLVFTGLLGLSQGGTVTASVASAAGSYALTPKARLVDTNEMALLRRAAEEIPADNVVVSSPWTGASMVYAIADRKSLTPHIFSEFGADTSTILNRLNQAGEDPEICEAVQRLKAYYVLDFGTREIHGHVHTMPGLVDMETDPDFTLVDSEGAAKLYKVTACGV
jgi:hypothetical protein